ncbi:hypothetical protein COUCH_24680 [Couchioplanes caeruleus]|uniref:hypothetical protein n=1 Tax=Couchioplanes caeruleus TaxID=56438 RepID=UPI0020C167F2|nr:hypothetical protein [Couchioplanes caeruleus]UQU62225.1 hypothetical protein COUCH_24680 [Couchioplanes caeruleus]
MATVEDLVERARPLLPPGSRIRHAFICQAAPNFAYFFVNWATGLTMFMIKYRCVAITDDAIVVMDGPSLSGGARPTSILGTMPRHTRLGPVSGRWSEVDLLGERHWVKKRFHGEITAADAEAGFTYAS